MFGLQFNKYIVYVAIALIATAIISTYVLMWKANIRKQALLEFNNKQLEQTIRDQEKFISDMRKITEQQRSILAETQKKNEELAKQVAGIEDYLSSEQTRKDDRPASTILKETIRRLSGQKP
jgi:uncharacterized protein YoxC